MNGISVRNAQRVIGVLFGTLRASREQALGSEGKWPCVAQPFPAGFRRRPPYRARRVFGQRSGTASVGVEVDRRGPAVDVRTGVILKSCRFACGENAFVGDVVIAEPRRLLHADSREAMIYRVPLSGDFVPTPGVNNRQRRCSRWPGGRVVGRDQGHGSAGRRAGRGGVLRWTGLPVQRPLRRTVHARDDVQHGFSAGAGQSEGSVSRSSHRPPVPGITRLGNLIVASRK